MAEQELNNVLINADLVPESMSNGDKETIINSWGGDVRVGTYYIKTETPLLSLQYNGVPSSACIKLVSQTASSNEQVVVGISPGVTTTIVRDGSNRDVIFGTKKNDHSQTISMDIATITEWCNKSPSAIIIYKFI